MNTLPVQRASQLASAAVETQWLVEGLWSEQAVGILGGEPKCCKSFLALDMAVCVASGAACLRHFPVHRPGSVLLFPAEDSLTVVRQRLQGICAAAGVGFPSLSVDVITAPALRLDTAADRQRLASTLFHSGQVLPGLGIIQDRQAMCRPSNGLPGRAATRTNPRNSAPGAAEQAWLNPTSLHPWH